MATGNKRATITLANGLRLKARMIGNNAEALVVEVPGGMPATIPQSIIVRVEEA